MTNEVHPVCFYGPIEFPESSAFHTAQRLARPTQRAGPRGKPCPTAPPPSAPAWRPSRSPDGAQLCLATWVVVAVAFTAAEAAKKAQNS